MQDPVKPTPTDSTRDTETEARSGEPSQSDAASFPAPQFPEPANTATITARVVEFSPTEDGRSVAVQFCRSLRRPLPWLGILLRGVIVALMIATTFGHLAVLDRANRVTSGRLELDANRMDLIQQVGFIAYWPILLQLWLAEVVLVVLLLGRLPWRWCQLLIPLAVAGLMAGFSLLLFTQPLHGPKENLLALTGGFVGFLGAGIYLYFWHSMVAAHELHADYPIVWYALLVLLAVGTIAALLGWTNLPERRVRHMLDYQQRKYGEPLPPLNQPPVESPIPKV